MSITERQQNRQPAYLHQFRQFYFDGMELIAQYRQQVLEGRDTVIKQEQDVQATKDQLDATGLPENNKWATLQRTIERIEIEKRRQQLIRPELEYRLQIALDKIYGWYYCVLDDFNGGYITKEVFAAYMQDYKFLLDAGKDVEFMQTYNRTLVSNIQVAIEQCVPLNECLAA